jgi:hypothetical protein
MTIPAAAVTAIAHYLSKGLTKDVATGICACLYYESKLSPDSQGAQSTETPGVLNPSGAYGIASWNGPRQQALLTFATAKDEDPSAIGTQLDFVLTECANSYPVVWKAIQNPTETYTSLITTFVTSYEIPANIQAEITASLAYAKVWYPEVIEPAPAPTTIPTTPTTIPAPVTTGSPVVTTGSTVVTAAPSETNLAIITALAEAIIKYANS